MKILAVDLGKMKSVACDFESESSEHVFETVRTGPEALAELIVRQYPGRGCPSRRKIAIVTVARRLLIWCWAMMRDDQNWNPKTELAAA